ncbi:hypothetical protein [Microbulbifer discodermiae]|uniref:hypothetical protein n=1 Tax=Microbulbifer sp. 2201CG32-9 TaxID=3232309 RepID=UPI00345B9374
MIHSLKVFFKVVLPALLISQQAIATGNSENGIYSYIYTPDMSPSNPRYTELEDSITNSGIDGVFLVEEWDQVEPMPNTFDWSNLDHWLTLSIQHDKKLSIGVVGGRDAPSWLAQPPYNVPTVSLGWDKDGKVGGDCEYKEFPVPWNAYYKSRYLNMMTSLRSYLQGFTVPGYSGSALSRLEIVKVAGINVSTTELKLPVSNSVNDTYCLPASGIDNTTAWKNAGYQPIKILSAWGTIAAGLASTYSAKHLAVSIITGYKAFPKLNNQGNPIVGPNASTGDFLDPLTEDILAAGTSTYAGRFHAAWDGLGTNINANSGIYTELQSNVLQANPAGEIGFQLNTRAGTATTGCGNTHHVCTQAEYQVVLQSGINLGAKYLEVHTNDAARFPASMFSTYSAMIQ